jgi:hypothetical protein
MKEHFIPYAAGLIDGEGSVCLSRNYKTEKFRHPTVSVASTTPELVHFMKDNFGGYISTKKTYKENHLESYTWYVSYDSAISFLEKVEPYLLEPNKKIRAKMIIEQYKSLTKRNGKYTKSEIEEKLQFETDFFHLSNSKKIGIL